MQFYTSIYGKIITIEKKIQTSFCGFFDRIKQSGDEKYLFLEKNGCHTISISIFMYPGLRYADKKKQKKHKFQENNSKKIKYFFKKTTE